MAYRELAGVLNQLAGTTNLELVHAINVKAGITSPPFLEFAGACNVAAGTTGLAALHALNVAAGNTLP